MPAYQLPVNGSKISEAYAEAMASAPITRVMLATYEFRHPSFTENGAPYTIRVVNDFTNIIARLEVTAPNNPGEYVEFEAVPVDVTGPEEGETGTVPSVNISIDGVSGQIVEQLDYALQTSAPIYMTQRIYASDDLSAPHRLPVITMTLRSIVVGDVTITATGSFFDTSNNTFPRKEYTPEQYPTIS